MNEKNFKSYNKVGEVFLLNFHVVVIDGKSELDHSVDSGGELGGLIQGESGGKERGVEQQPDKVLDGLVSLVLVGLLLQLSDDWVVWVDFHGLLGDHVGSHGGVSEGLSLHDSLHVGGPSVLSGDEDAWGFLESLSNDDLLNLISKDFLEEINGEKRRLGLVS